MKIIIICDKIRLLNLLRRHNNIKYKNKYLPDDTYYMYVYYKANSDYCCIILLVFIK